MTDKWARWVLGGRDGSDPGETERMRTLLEPIRDRVISAAAIGSGDVVLDVGAGDGLIAFEAIRHVGDDGLVIFSDISEVLLTRCRNTAAERGIESRCRFVRASADDLSPIGDASVDVVTTRSVLVYVRDKAGAFAEFFRVLRPRGRLSIFEPINTFAKPEPEHLLWGYDVTPVRDLASRVRAVYQRLQPPGIDPMLDFDERDLLRLARETGFDDVSLTYEAEIARRPVARAGWEVFARSAPNPSAPSPLEAIDEALSAAEAKRFVDHLRALVDRRDGVTRMATAYLRAVK